MVTRRRRSAQILTALAVGVLTSLLAAPVAHATEPGEHCATYEFHYDDGHVDSGTWCGKGWNATEGLHVNMLHLSCSDTFEGGTSTTSDLAGHTVVSWSIVKDRGAPCSGGTPPGQEPPGDEPPSDEPPSDEPPSDEPPSDEPPSDEPPSDEPPSDEPPSDEPPSDEPPSDDQAPDAAFIPSTDRPAPPPGSQDDGIQVLGVKDERPGQAYLPATDRPAPPAPAQVLGVQAERTLPATGGETLPLALAAGTLALWGWALLRRAAAVDGRR